MTPFEFSAVFDRIIMRGAQDVVRNWESNQKFTEFLLCEKDPKGVCPELADVFGLRYCREYWRSDAVMFERLDEKHFASGGTYAEHLSVAIEVENDPWSAKDEVSKLMTLNTPLRVLITYPNKKYQSLLSIWTEIVTKADWALDASTLRRLLLVFGFLEKKTPRWEYLTYCQGEFVKIE